MSLPPEACEPRRVGGGDINEAFHVRLRGEEAFVKTRPNAGEGEYALEAAGLGWLGQPEALRAPRVIEVGNKRRAYSKGFEAQLRREAGL
jgi:fructosamine-3-kinase